MSNDNIITLLKGSIEKTFDERLYNEDVKDTTCSFLSILPT
jgi:hypothetical protein